MLVELFIEIISTIDSNKPHLLWYLIEIITAIFPGIQIPPPS